VKLTMTKEQLRLVARILDCHLSDITCGRPSTGYLHETWFASSADRAVVYKKFDASLVGDLTIPGDDIIANTTLAGSFGIGARVLHADSVNGELVLARLDGQPMTEEDVKAPDNLRRVASALRRLHDTPELPANRVDFLSWSDDWLHSLAHADSHWSAPLAQLRRELDHARRAVTTFGEREVFSHNDLLPANLLPTGENVHIIDYDFSGRGTPLFDLGCLFANCRFTDAERNAFIEAYTGLFDAVLMARAEVYEILALHANAVVFAWADCGYSSKYQAIAAEMSEAIESQFVAAQSAVAAGRLKDALRRAAPTEVPG
jgi:aminoglycoside phosphotransferase (APT) family kinase protein